MSCNDVRSAGLFHTTKHKPIWDFASLAERHLRGEVLSISGAPVRHKAAWRKTGVTHVSHLAATPKGQDAGERPWVPGAGERTQQEVRAGPETQV